MEWSDLLGTSPHDWILVYSSIQGGPVSNEPNKRFGKLWDESVIDKADQDHHRVQILLKKKRSAEHDAHVVPAWCATQDELVKIMDFVPSYSVQGALNHRCCVCRCWFLIVPISLAWHVSQAESVVAPTPAALSPSEFIKHPTESYPLQPYSALHPIDWDLPGLGWSLYNPLWESSPLRQISRDCR
jgi:hypothetical protein